MEVTYNFDCQFICGNGFNDSEDCDDGNPYSGDGCSSTCKVEPNYTCDNNFPSVCTLNPVCGNGVLQANEACDDGNGDSGDGCSSACTVESNA